VTAPVFLYLVTYRAVARNTDTATLAAALGAIPRDVDTETLLGLVSLADVTTSAPPFATRAMSYTSSPSAMIPNPQLGQFLRNYYRSTFSQALSTPVVASPVSTVEAPQAPLLWLRADAGVPSPVNRWTNLMGTGIDAVQAVVANQPAQGIAVAIGQQVVHFDAAGPDGLATSAPLAFDDFSYLLTFHSPLAATPGILYERSIDATAHSGENLFESSPSTVVATRSAVTHTANLSVNWGVDGHWHLAAYLYDASAGGALFVDDLTTPAASFAALSPQAVSATLFLGARGPGFVLPFNGDLRELLVFAERLSPADLASIGAYMKLQVGL
jgi:hypothetical protein